MPQYHYTALNISGGQVQGTDTALDQAALKQLLKKRRLILIKAKEAAVVTVPFKYCLRLATELNDLIGGGITLERALLLLSQDSQDPGFKQLCQQLQQNIKNGLALSEALSQVGKFDPLFIPLITAGEASGRLAETLTVLEQYYLNKKEFKSNLTSSLAYPAILLITSVLAIIALALYIIPVFKDLFADDMEKLPLGTQISFIISDWLIDYGPVLLMISTSLVVGLVLGLKYHAKTKFYWHRLLLYSPVIGSLISNTEALKLFRVFSILLKSGVPLLKTLQISQNVLNNLVQRQGLSSCIQHITQGGTLADNLNDIPRLPVIAGRLIKVGDETGKLGESCQKTASIIQRELNSQLKTLVALIEPIVILTMGGVIGFVIISMLMAVFSISDLV